MTVQVPVLEGSSSRRSALTAKVEELVRAGLDAERFVESFEVLAEAAGGAKHVRSLIVGLALRGRLLPTEVDFSEPSRTPSRGNEDAELPPLPSGWSWVRIDSILKEGPKNGYSPKGVEHETPVKVLTLTATTSGCFDGRFFKYTAESVPADSEFWLRDGDVLVQRGNTIEYVGIAAVYRGPPKTFIYPDLMMRIRISDDVDVDFVHMALNGPVTRGFLRSRASGTAGTMPKINQTTLQAAPIPLPPLQEQKRIVAKVDQLMALCDELEARQTRKRDLGTRVTTSALEALTTAEGPEEFEVAWKRVLENFETVFPSASSVASLRHLILDLAFRGSLIGPIEADRAAASVLDEVNAAWANRKRKEPLATVSDGERPASPKRWAWVRLGNLAEVVGGVTKGRDLKGRKVRAYPYLRVANVQRGVLDLAVMKQIEIAEEEFGKYRLHLGDILFTEGGDWDKLGRSAVWRGEIEECIHQNHVFRARVVTEMLDPLWFSIFANSPVGRRYFEEAAKQTTNLASINMTQLRNCPMPVPPLREGQLIVAKVDQLMKVCDALEAHLRRAEDRASKLAEAVVQDLTA